MMRGGTCKSELLTPVVSYWHWVFIQGGTERTKNSSQDIRSDWVLLNTKWCCDFTETVCGQRLLTRVSFWKQRDMCVRYWTQVQFYYNTSS